MANDPSTPISGSYSDHQQSTIISEESQDLQQLISELRIEVQEID